MIDEGAKFDALRDMVGELKTEVIRLADRIDSNARDQSTQLNFIRDAGVEARAAFRAAIDAEAKARGLAIQTEADTRRTADEAAAEAIKALAASWQRATSWATAILGTVIASGLVYVLYTTR